MFLQILIFFPLLPLAMASGRERSSSWWLLKKNVNYIKEQIRPMPEMNKTLSQNLKNITEMNETLFQSSKKLREIIETLCQIKEAVENSGSGQTEKPKRKRSYFNMSQISQTM